MGWSLVINCGWCRDHEIVNDFGELPEGWCRVGDLTFCSESCRAAYEKPVEAEAGSCDCKTAGFRKLHEGTCACLPQRRIQELMNEEDKWK